MVKRSEVNNLDRGKRWTLLDLSEAARSRYAADTFDDAWISQMHAVITDTWPTADSTAAELLVSIMAATPYSGWMNEFLIPAERGQLPHANIILRHFDAIAAAGAEGIAREDGITRRA